MTAKNHQLSGSDSNKNSHDVEGARHNDRHANSWAADATSRCNVTSALTVGCVFLETWEMSTHLTGAQHVKKWFSGFFSMQASNVNLHVSRARNDFATSKILT